MKRCLLPLCLVFALSPPTCGEPPAPALAPAPPAKPLVEGTGPGWKSLTRDDFRDVNGKPDTWTFRPDGVIACTGDPVGVIRTAKIYTNLEIVVEWRHLKAAGNSGVFLWAAEKPLLDLKPGQLPHGIEVQILDHGYTEQYEAASKRKATWFTTHGDVFPVGAARLTPFAPLSPDGSRSFPKFKSTKGVGEWNHYHIRAVGGEVRLTVNGVEVSGGSGANPATGYLCLESEGSPIEFRNLRVRELP